jgi:hypothetical protein
MNYKLCEGVTIEHVDGHGILITEKGDAAVLNETAEFILSLLINGNDDKVAIQKVAETYNVDNSIVNSDVEKLVCELADKELIESLSSIK